MSKITGGNQRATHFRLGKLVKNKPPVTTAQLRHQKKIELKDMYGVYRNMNTLGTNNIRLGIGSNKT